MQYEAEEPAHAAAMFAQDVRDMWGWTPIPYVRPDGSVALRYYGGESGMVYEGEPEFRYEEWLARGANWEVVMEEVR